MQEWRQHGEGGVHQLQQQGGLRRRNIKTRKSYRCEIDPKIEFNLFKILRFMCRLWQRFDLTDINEYI